MPPPPDLQGCRNLESASQAKPQPGGNYDAIRLDACTRRMYPSIAEDRD
jgi:hypothetical protein